MTETSVTREVDNLGSKYERLHKVERMIVLGQRARLMNPTNSIAYRTPRFAASSSWLCGASPLDALAVFGTARVASAQLGVGILSGPVRDVSTKKPLADVAVTATSPALQGDHVAVADKSGAFPMPNLPPGDFMLGDEADTFHPLARSVIALRATIALRVGAEVLADTSQAEKADTN